MGFRLRPAVKHQHDDQGREVFTHGDGAGDGRDGKKVHAPAAVGHLADHFRTPLYGGGRGKDAGQQLRVASVAEQQEQEHEAPPPEGWP